MDILKTRTALGLTQQQLAVSLGVVVATVWRWEMGISKPSPLAKEKLLALESEAKRARK